jgi:DNA-directed RNA polymerase subunit N (RpoN/RPB10)
MRCFTCNKFIGHFKADYDARKKELSDASNLSRLGMTRMCCRVAFLTHVDVIEDIIQYAQDNVVLDDSKTRLHMRNDNIRTVSCE